MSTSIDLKISFLHIFNEFSVKNLLLGGPDDVFRFFLNRFPVCFFVLLFLVTPCLVVAVQP